MQRLDQFYLRREHRAGWLEGQVPSRGAHCTTRSHGTQPVVANMRTLRWRLHRADHEAIQRNLCQGYAAAEGGMDAHAHLGDPDAAPYDEIDQQGDIVFGQIELEEGVIERGTASPIVVKDLFNCRKWALGVRHGATSKQQENQRERDASKREYSRKMQQKHQ